MSGDDLPDIFQDDAAKEEWLRYVRGLSNRDLTHQFAVATAKVAEGDPEEGSEALLLAGLLMHEMTSRLHHSNFVTLRVNYFIWIIGLIIWLYILLH